MTIINDIAESIISKINKLITAHNTSSNAHNNIIPKKTSDLTNDSGFLTSHQDISGKVDKAQGSGNANKNVVTNSSGDIALEAKPTIPTASASTPDADTTSGAIGTSTNYARADHKHPKSTLYAEASHSHNYTTAETVDTKISTHNGSSVAHTDIRNSITEKADSDHTHTKSEITDFPTSMTPKSHNSTSTTYGVGTSVAYGHCKVINDLNISSHSNGVALSAYQGKVLKGLVDSKARSSHSHTKSDISDFPTLSTVATSGSYNDLSNKPSIPSDVSDLTDNSNTQFTPKAHTQALSTITDTDTVEVLVTYTDNTTETLDLVVMKKIVTNVVLTQNGNTFTATVTNAKGNGINGKTVTFYLDNSSIGTATTKNNGVATYNIPSYGDIKAVCDGVESNIISL